MNFKKAMLVIITFVALIILSVILVLIKKEKVTLIVTNFEECAATGSPVMESYPRQCRFGNQIFVENIGNELEKMNLIRINSPRPNQVIQSPLTIAGEARGVWFFEASFPVVLTNWDGLIIAQGIATAKSDWMTTEFVPFEARLIFNVDKNVYSNRGTLILRKDNPSGLPEHDDALEIPVIIDGDIATPKACTQEAKLCSDGSYVSRTGPNCEFSLCPSTDFGKQCAGPSDTSCSVGYECVQECGPPVIRYPEDTPPKYFCQPKGYIRNCPICLAKNTLIDTSLGLIPVQEIKKGAVVWTINKSGQRVLSEVIQIGKTLVPSDHKMVKLVLLDGRTLFVSPGHPTIDGRTIEDLTLGDGYDGSWVIFSNLVDYGNEYTYDILPSGETGFYFANGIILDSTLRH